MKGAQWMDIRSDRQKGLSYVELGRKCHMDPRTAKRHAESPQKPEYTLSEPKPTKMDPYKRIRGRVAGGGAVFGAADLGEAAGDGI